MAKAKLDAHAIEWKMVPSAGVQLQNKDKTVETQSLQKQVDLWVSQLHGKTWS